ncbi:MAG: sigma-54-dependent Fis family transcriptional regulator [Deltaproteobacteria bacterium]|nr:sigma-54-dependent Fis family transcriptional regulator [Deltaproteobacteria bacterium]
MSQTRILPYLGPAIVFYLVAWVVSLPGELDTIGHLTAVVALLVSLAGFLGSRRPDTKGAQRISLLSACAAAAIVESIRPTTLSFTLEAVHLAALGGFAGLVTDLTLSVPDRAWPAMHPNTARVVPYLISLILVAISLSVVAPLIKPFGDPWLIPTWMAQAPLAYALVALALALLIRLLRSRLGSGPEALAANSWAIMGLVPASFIAAVLLILKAVGLLDSTDALYRGALAVIAVCVVSGHLFMVDKRRRLSAGKAARNVVAATLTMALLALFVIAFRLHVPEQPWQLVLLLVATLLASTGVFFGFQPIVTRLLAPYAGRLLHAIDLAVEQLIESRSLDEIAKAVLVPMRRATGSLDAEPLLYGFDPEWEARVDVAGQPHLAPRSLSHTIARYLRDNPGEIVLRGSLEAMIVRRPPLRPLVDALVNLDALCVVPLATKEELEGALIIPRGIRMSALTLEEIAALARFSRFLATFVSVLSAEMRAQKRASDSDRIAIQAAEEARHSKHEIAKLQAGARVLKAGGSFELLKAPLIAYSSAMRAFIKCVDDAIQEPTPLLLLAESGTALHAVAYRMHERSGREGNAFVIGDCASVGESKSGLALFGEGDGTGDYPGWLTLAAGGSLFLLDLPALPREVQRSLAWALATRQAQRIDGNEAYPLDVKLIATTRVDPRNNEGFEFLEPELTKRFASQLLRVPPLRERQEDLPSLILMEIDRASRVLGRPVVGIEPQALAVLQKHHWPGNQEELRFVVQKAVENCQGERIQEADLAFVAPAAQAPKAMLSPSDFHLEGTLEVVERRIIEQALATAAGNKSEAARILGLKRTTFLDKLRRYSLD